MENIILFQPIWSITTQVNIEPDDIKLLEISDTDFFNYSLFSKCLKQMNVRVMYERF